ncbi:UDP-glucuronosyltransferase 2B31-like [Amphiura filiformis]|uniref:UDP-glucuronosyltransferase 2B31-like n=1 Tax=Amphiura filiformis TaxID=82378 RepID=UPI003B21755D
MIGTTRKSTCIVLGIVLLLAHAVLVNCGKVLINPLMGEGSHYIVAVTIGKELVRRGHEVTMLTDDRFIDNVKLNSEFKFEFYKANFTLDEFHDLVRNMTNAGLKGKYMEWTMSMMKTNHMERVVSECHNFLKDVELIEKLRKAEYDITITDSSSLCPAMQYLQTPYIVLSPVITIPAIALLQNRVPFNPSYMPGFTTAYDSKMTFKERLVNSCQAAFFSWAMYLFQGSFEKTKRQYGVSLNSFSDAELWLLNTHYALDFPRPLLPNTKIVGGLTTKPAESLGKEWIEFLESAGEDGVVLFSMGSYATGIDEDVAGLFAGAFAQLPQKVIWKLNGKPSATLTPNVKVVDWIPQNDLLGHPQIKAFVYHCGIHGIWEAVYHGVPMVAVPLFGDQYDNAQRLVSRGMAVKLDIPTLTSDELAQAIRTVIDNPSYKNNASRISAIFRDSPRTPTEEAADWIEYAIRHGGAKHLRSAALDLNIFQYLLLDVIAVLLLALITFMVIFYCSCKLCYKGCRYMCGRSRKVKSE